MATQRKKSAAKSKKSSSSARPRAGASTEAPLLDNEGLQRLYAALLQFRLASDSRAARKPLDSGPPQRSGGHPLRAMEAAEAACTIALRAEDLIVASPAGAFAGKFPGVAPQGMLNLFRSGARRIQQLSAARLISTAALSAREKKSVVLVFRQGFTAQEWRKLLLAAEKQSLPILFICSEKSRTGLTAESLTAESRRRERGRVSLPVIPVDAHDVVAIYRIVHEAVKRARRGGGPAFIDCRPYLPDALPVRARAYAVNGSRRRAIPDAIQRMEEYLKLRGLFESSWKEEAAEKLSSALKLPPRKRGNEPSPQPARAKNKRTVAFSGN